MKRLCALVMLTVCCFFSGCDLWMSGHYHSVTPHLSDNAQSVQSDVEVSSYKQLQEAVVRLVENGGHECILYLTGFDQDTLDSQMDRMIAYVTQVHPVGAYAVEDVTYVLGTNAGRQAVAVNVTYVHNRSEILRIKDASDMQSAASVITHALEECETGVVVLVEHYENLDLVQMIQDHVDENPQICMEMPQVSAAVYPETGDTRVIELTFTYQTSRETLRTMQTTVEPVFASAELYVSGDADSREKYAQLYAFLMERYDYTLQTSITPSYSLLRHGVGDSKAFATVYAAMCRQAGLDCQAVSGTKNGESYWWNVLLQEETYYFVDLLQCSKDQTFRMCTREEMVGYVWDYSAYELTDELQPVE